MFAYFGGITPYVVVDISKAVSTRPTCTTPMSMLPTVILPITWALRYCRPDPKALLRACGVAPTEGAAVDSKGAA